MDSTKTANRKRSLNGWQESWRVQKSKLNSVKSALQTLRNLIYQHHFRNNQLNHYVKNLSTHTHILDAGDKILITGPTTGAVYIELDDPRVNLESVETVRKGDRVSFKVPGKVRPSDKLYRIDKTEHGCCD